MILALRSQQRKWSCNHSHARTDRIYFFRTYLGNVNFSTFGWLMLMYDVYNFGSAICASPYFSNINKLNSREFFGGGWETNPWVLQPRWTLWHFTHTLEKLFNVCQRSFWTTHRDTNAKWRFIVMMKIQKKNPEFLFFIWTKFWED